MLSKNYLKVISASIVYESKLSRISKIQLLKFIENEATQSQLKILILDGEIRKVSENEKDLDKRFVSEIIPALIAIGIIVPAALALGKKAYIDIFSKAAKACVGKKGKERTNCMKDYRIKANYARLAALKREMSKCNQTANTDKCRQVFTDHMRKIQKQIRKDQLGR